MLRVSIRKALQGFSLECEFSTHREIIAILGPSGSGKTITLKCIAGLLKPDEGRIELNGRVLFDSAAGINLPPQRRKVGFVFQDYALFPHLTVRQNAAYGINHLSRRAAEAAVSGMLDKLRIGGLASRYPKEISSGQQQRVSLARALSQGPDLLLLDEPFSSLDTPRRERLEFELLAMQQDYTGEMLLVTHDLDQGYKLGSKIAVYEAGKMVQCGSKRSVLGAPANRTVARLVGMRNFMEGQVAGVDDGDVWVAVPGLGTLRAAVRQPAASAGARVTIGIRPEHIRIAPGPGENVIACAVDGIFERITDVAAHFHSTGGGEPHDFEAVLSRQEAGMLGPGRPCYLYLDPGLIAVFDS